MSGPGTPSVDSLSAEPLRSAPIAADAATPHSSAPVWFPPPPPPPPPPRSTASGPIAFLRRHPLLVLLLLSPGIVEYLSGSSRVDALVRNPPWFAIQLALNAGLYVPGVLLIREAAVRWHKGWATVLVLGAAYGILEEGVALSTMFNPSASVVGGLGSYGHWMGVNTVWVPGVVIVHMLWSIGLPILLFGLIFPELRGQPLLGGRRLSWTLLALGADVTVLALAITVGAHYFMGPVLLVGCFATIAGLVYLAYRLPADLLERSAPAVGSPSRLLSLLVGVAFYPAMLFAQAIPESAQYAPAVAIGAIVLVALGFAAVAYRWFRGAAAYSARLWFLLGTLLPVMFFGFVSQFPIDLVLVGDALAVLLFLRLARRAPAAGLATAALNFTPRTRAGSPLGAQPGSP